LREIHNAIAELLERAAIVRGRFHRADLYHRLLVAELAAYRAAAQDSDLVRRHHRSPDVVLTRASDGSRFQPQFRKLNA
jgi:hypothetical protein